MRNPFCAFAVALVLVSFSFAQDEPAKEPAKPKEAAGSPCPQIQIQNAQGRTLREGQPLNFVVSIAGGDPTVQPTIVWSVSAGNITGGQGTRRIDVDTTGAGAYREIVADLWVGGYAPECQSQASANVKVIGPPVKVDEFGLMESEKESERVNAISAPLAQTVDNIYIIAYAGRTSVRGFAYNELRRLKDLLAKGGIPSHRIGTIDGGFREEPAFEIWAAPQGADAPKPTPTVDRREIVYPTTPRPTRNNSTRRP